MVVLDTAIANVSLRYIAGSLAASVDESTWIVTTYLIANAVILPVSGWLSNVIGRKRFYMICVAVFTVELAVVRAGAQPHRADRVSHSARPWRRRHADQRAGDARRHLSAAEARARRSRSTASPSSWRRPSARRIGGWITDNYSWHWIFFINVPFGILSLVLVQWLVVEPEVLERERHERLAGGLKIDWVGFALIALTFGCLEFVLDRGQIDDWFHSATIVMFAPIAGVLVHILYPLGAHAATIRSSTSGCLSSGSSAWRSS